MPMLATKTDQEIQQDVFTLEGRVRTWPEKDAVLGTVRHAPGVREVVDHVSVSP